MSPRNLTEYVIKQLRNVFANYFGRGGHVLGDIPSMRSRRGREEGPRKTGPAESVTPPSIKQG